MSEREALKLLGDALGSAIGAAPKTFQEVAHAIRGLRHEITLLKALRHGGVPERRRGRTRKTDGKTDGKGDK